MRSPLATRLLGAACALALSVSLAFGQGANNPVIQAPTTNFSVSITTGLTYQLVLAAQTIVEPPPPSARHSLTIQNNQASGSDLCYVIVANAALAAQITPGSTTTSSGLTVNGASIAAGKASIVLSVGQSYTRYFPYVPSDAVYATCATTADSLYVDTQ